MNRARLREWLPPNRYWAGIEGSALLIGVAIVLLRILASSPPPAAAAPVVHRTPTLDASSRDRLLRVFPATPVTPREGVELLKRIMDRMHDLNLTLEARHDEPLPAHAFPPRQRLRLLIKGTAPAEVELLRFLLENDVPVVIPDLQWKRGDGPTARILEVTLEVLRTPE